MSYSVKSGQINTVAALWQLLMCGTLAYAFVIRHLNQL